MIQKWKKDSIPNAMWIKFYFLITKKNIPIGRNEKRVKPKKKMHLVRSMLIMTSKTRGIRRMKWTRSFEVYVKAFDIKKPSLHKNPDYSFSLEQMSKKYLLATGKR